MRPERWISMLLITVIVYAENGQGHENFRLPENVIPDRYRIKILTDLSENFFYNGEVCIDFLVKTTTNKIVLHSKNLKIFENETKVEEYGQFMGSDNEKIIRRPKEIPWDGVEFRDRPKAELDGGELSDQSEESLRVLANKKRKPDVVFDRHEIFEKQKEGFSSESFSEEKPQTVTTNFSKKPLSSDGMILHEKIKESYSKDKRPIKVTLSSMKPQNDRMKITTTEKITEDMLKPSSLGYTKNPHISTTIDDKIPVPMKTHSNEVKISSTESMISDILIPSIDGHTNNHQESTTMGDKIRLPVKTHTEETKFPTTESVSSDVLGPSTAGHTHKNHKSTTMENNMSEMLTTKATNPNTHKSTTIEYTKGPYESTTLHVTTDDKIHFITHSTEAILQHAQSQVHKTTTVGNKTPLIQHTTQSSIIPPAIGIHHPMKDTLINVVPESYSVLKHDFDIENNFLTLHLDKPLVAGKSYKLYLTYQGVLTDTLTGFHRVPYMKRGSAKSSWLASTVFEPNEARTAFPCFDEPAFKATFDVTLGHDKKYMALSNMPLKSKTPIEGKPDWQWSEFETTPRMSTYMVAFLISDLEYLTPRVNYTESGPNVTYRFWSRPDVLYKTRYAMRIAPEMKNYLENLLEVRDVLPKHDFVALPSFISSALENWGLYSFAEKNLLFTPGFSSIFSKYEITHVLGHEIAHMWFGNMVTPKWWDQIWLSEGFSNFFEIIAADHVQPSWDLKSISVIFSYLKVFTFDALHSSHPLVPKLKHPNDLNEIFDSITYQKGFYLVRMLNYTLGQEAFMNGVRRYLKNNLLSNVDEDDLWDVLTECAHQENTLPVGYHLKDIMHSWTRKTGYPIIDVIRDYENHTANVTQRRFLRSKDDYEFRDNSQDFESENTKWWIPLTYTTGSELNFRDFKPRVWLSPEDDNKILTDMPSRSDFVLMNLDAAGLYRVNYDERNWGLIISYLINENSSDISVINRVQILDDLLDLARAGEISYERALDATSYLAKEKHFLPWKAALSNFDFISRMLRQTDSNKSLKKFLRNLVSPRFDELGFESVRNEQLSDGLNRKQIVKWACRTGLRQCTRKSISLFKKWTEEKKPDEHNPIPSNLRSVVYCTAIENGGSKDWQFLWQRYLSNVVTDKTAILYGLGCSKSTRTLRKYLDWSIKESSGIKKQDTPTVFKAVVRNDAGFSLAKNFLKERMGDIKAYLGSNPFYLPQMIETIASKMNQPSDLEELEELEQAHFSHLRSVPRSVKQAAERVKFNINWVEKNYKPINDWLKRQRM